MIGPLLPSVGVVALVPDQWDSHWQSRHHVLSRLARYFHVVWMNPVGGSGRLRSSWLRTRKEGAFTVYEPGRWLGKVWTRPRLLPVGGRLQLWQVVAALRRAGCRLTLLSVWRPEFAPALDFGKFDAACYHVDDEYSFSGTEVALGAAEASLLARVGQVFIHSPALLERMGHLNPCTAFVPNGVDFDQFATRVSEPAALATIPRPRIGYAGAIKKQLDLDLLTHLALRHPGWSFVFVGPQSPHPEVPGFVADLGRLPNVQFLGGRPHKEVAAYVQHFDVCLMPYVQNAYTRYIYPLKLHEYLAAGRPSVGTRIRTLEDFVDVVTLASTPDEWSAAIGRALEPAADTPERAAARRAAARRHDWGQLVATIARALASLVNLEAKLEPDAVTAAASARDRRAWDADGPHRDA
jgi:glycosyltransferase involved in cell wall biosynthesis